MVGLVQDGKREKFEARGGLAIRREKEMNEEKKPRVNPPLCGKTGQKGRGKEINSKIMQRWKRQK